jgi:hypothetical protein
LLIFLLALAVPAFAKSHNEKQPIACSDLWPAVTQALHNAGNYRVLAMNDEEMRANFIVVGALFSQTDMVHLKPRNSGGCQLQLRIGFTGADDDWAFRSRVNRAFKKLNAAKASEHLDSGQAQ